MTDHDGGEAPPRPARAPRLPGHPLCEIERDEVVWAGRYPVQRVRYRYRRRDGSLSGPVTWELLRRGQGAVILPWDPVRDRVALIEQFRLPALAAGEEPRMVELPAGLVDGEEDPLATARRELEEETGLVAGRVARIGSYLLLQGASDERVHFHVAEVSLAETGERVRGLAAEDEETVVRVVDAAEAFAMVAENRIRNASAALGLLWLQVNCARLRGEWGMGR